MASGSRPQFEVLEWRCCLTSVGWDGPGLGEASLTYYIGDIPDEIDAEKFREAIVTAFKAWTDVVDIEVAETNLARLRNSIDINFGELDGRGGTLAQAYLPDDVNRGRSAGDILFDNQERWEFGNTQRRAATDLVLVAVHEIGHALGLEHSGDAVDVMFASVPSNASFNGLSQGDVDAILSLYAPRRISLFGDVNEDGALSSLDIDWLAERIRSDDANRHLDLSSDGLVNFDDHRILVQVIFATDFGDGNLDGVFDSRDLTLAFHFGLYENRAPSIAAWVAGDWNGDGTFDSGDLILALQTGRYVV